MSDPSFCYISKSHSNYILALPEKLLIEYTYHILREFMKWK
jgi:hypothetical protein